MNHLKSSCPTPGKVHKGVDLSAEGTSVLLGCFVLFCFSLCISQDMETSNQGLKGFSKWEQKQNWALKGRKWYFIKNMDITYPRCLSLFLTKVKVNQWGKRVGDEKRANLFEGENQKWVLFFPTVRWLQLMYIWRCCLFWPQGLDAYQKWWDMLITVIFPRGVHVLKLSP